MQIFGTDVYNRHLLCLGATGAAISILFKLDATAASNPFFAWQADAKAGNPITVDPSLVLSKIAGTINSVSGYSGTDTMPGCTTGTCWYVIN